MHCSITFRFDYCVQHAVASCLIDGTPIQGSRHWESIRVTDCEEIVIDSARFSPADGGQQSYWIAQCQAEIDGNEDLRLRAEELLETASRDAKSFRRAG